MKKLFVLFSLCITAMLCAVCLTACSGSAEYSVVCQSSEHGYVTVSDKKAQAGEKVIIAAHPDAGYKLTAFVVDGAVINGVSFVMPQKDVTVFAQYEPITYSITYVLGDTTLEGSNPDSYSAENVPELIEPTKEGYEICAWYRYCVEDESIYDWDIEEYRVKSLEGLYGNLTLYAKYYNPPHTISVEDNAHGYCTVEDYGFEAYYGETYTVTVEPDIGYYLDGLYVNGVKIDGYTFTVPAADVEITAEFKPHVYRITYELFGGENSDENPVYFTVEDETIYLADATKEGCIFIGWCLDEECSHQIINGVLNVYYYLEEPLTLYAYFIEDYEAE